MVFALVVMRMAVVIRDKKIHINTKKIIQSENRFEALVENGSDCIIVLSKDYKLIYVSRSIKNILGYTTDELLVLSLVKLIHPDDVDEIEQNFNEAIKQPGLAIRGYIARIMHKDGSWRWLESITTNLLHHPYIKGFVNNFRDVTDRVIAEEKLKETSQRLLLATKGSKLGIWDQDIPNNKLVWDEGMFQLYGVSEDSFKGNFESWIELVYPEDRLMIQKKAEKVMKGEADFDVQFRIILPDKSIRYIRALALLKRDKEGKPIRLVGSNLDITADKEYESILEQISFNISHLISKPVSNMLKIALMIDNGEIDEKILKEYSGYIKLVDDELNKFTSKLNDAYNIKNKK